MEQTSVQEKDDNIWKIALAIICLVILAYGFFFSKNTNNDFAYLIGYNLPSSLIFWYIYYASVARKKSTKTGAFSFIAIYICMIASSLIGYSNQKHNAEKMLSEVQVQFSNLVDSATDTRGMPRRIEKPIDVTPKAHGDYGEIERFMKTYMDEIISLRNDYLLELEAIGWNRILDAERIKDDTGFIESKIIIRKAKQIVEKYQKKTDILMSKTRKDILSLKIEEPLKRELLQGFERGVERAKVQNNEMWGMERDVIGEFENIINLLSARSGSWVVQDGKLTFYNEEDLSRFNYYIASIKSIVSKQNQIQKQSLESFNRNMNSIKNDIR